MKINAIQCDECGNVFSGSDTTMEILKWDVCPECLSAIVKKHFDGKAKREKEEKNDDDEGGVKEEDNKFEHIKAEAVPEKREFDQYEYDRLLKKEEAEKQRKKKFKAHSEDERRAPMSAESIKEAQELRNRGVSVNNIARKLGKSQQTIYNNTRRPETELIAQLGIATEVIVIERTKDGIKTDKGMFECGEFEVLKEACKGKKPGDLAGRR